jgi:hypothetical protein
MARTIRRPITRETPDRDASYHETLMIKIEPDSPCLKIWQKGRRRKYAVCFRDIFRLAIMAEAKARITTRKR